MTRILTQAIIVTMLLVTLSFLGCTTVPKDFSAHSNAQLSSEFQQIDQQIALMEGQVRQLQGQAANATTQEEAAAANFAVVIAAAQLNQLYVNRNSAVSEAQKRMVEAEAMVTPSTTAPSVESVPASPLPATIVPPTPVPSPATQAETVVNPIPRPAFSTEVIPEDLALQGARKLWITEVFSNGRYVILDDDSVWEIDSIDTIDTSLWLQMEDVIIIGHPYEGYVFFELVNPDSDDRVSAAYLGQVALRTRIQSEFSGWEGETVFVMDTGNVFQQASYSYTYHYAYRPDVLIVDAGGYLKLVVDGVEESIVVILVK